MSVTGLVVVIIGAWLALPMTATVAQEEPEKAEKVDKPEKLAKDAEFALASLYEKVPATKTLAETSQSILVFPKITRASVGLGVQRGTGTLLKDGKPEGFYTTTGTSVGLQAGAKTYGYALFFMNDNAVQALSKAKGFEVGVGPTVVVVNKGTSKNLTTTTLKADIYAVIFDQKGLIAGLGVQGNRITKANPK